MDFSFWVFGDGISPVLGAVPGTILRYEVAQPLYQGITDERDSQHWRQGAIPRVSTSSTGKDGRVFVIVRSCAVDCAEQIPLLSG